jgi:hypothetical protein
VLVIRDNKTKVKPIAVFPVNRRRVQMVYGHGIKDEAIHLHKRSQILNVLMLVLKGQILPGSGLYVL